MAEYPNDGKRHPDLSDLAREILQAYAPAWPGIMMWPVLGIVLFWYPDWRSIVGYSLVVVGILTLIRVRCPGETPPPADK
ncbi:MAG: hypothetical protein KBD19_01300 [Candidatus Moranbacteria bacterium]|nr:hypothetical protein [Candidatus Moranbacteria bacterium]